GQQYPLVHVRATVSDSTAVIGQMERGEAQVGLVGRKPDNPDLDIQYLASDRMVFVVPPGHPLSGEKVVTASQLMAYPLVLREVGSGLRHCLEKALEKIERSLADFRVALEIGSNEAIKEAVARGVGVAVLSIFAVRKEVEAGQLIPLEGSDLKCDRDMFVVRDKRRVLPPPARLFLSFLRTTPVPAPIPARAYAFPGVWPRRITDHPSRSPLSRRRLRAEGAYGPGLPERGRDVEDPLPQSNP